MRAVRLYPPGSIDDLRLDEIETPTPIAGEALVEVYAAAITRDELTWPTDRLPAIPSYELSGVVADVASDVDVVGIGDACYALTPFDRDGVAAEYATVPAGLLASRPRNLDDVASATIPLTALSAWQGLFEHGRLEAGERVLITGAVGGVGHVATQLARWRGAHVIGIVSVREADHTRALGADEVHDPFGLAGKLDPVDLVFDTAGGEVLREAAEVVRDGGRLVSIAEEPPVTPGARFDASFFVVEPNRGQLEEITGLVERGDLRPAIDAVFPLDDARAAFARSMERGKRGKVVLQVKEASDGQPAR
jgi:NADPH:quinone reductase-like Zn-dependent oxidoreductase